MKEINANDLKARLNAGEKVILLDVRQPEEHEAQHIPNSMLIPLGELEERIDELEEYRDKEIIVYCRSGARSGQACMFLEMLGFEHPINLRGGMLSW
ncbi:MAG: rhodanese-like domain-containing protein [Ignavibacteriae bacterium]|nr:MAG: rhodanese-like domain-containing protein [Ignavibacteriota bacterium]